MSKVFIEQTTIDDAIDEIRELRKGGKSPIDMLRTKISYKVMDGISVGVTVNIVPDNLTTRTEGTINA